MIVGFVDIGSNAARLLVAELGPGRSWRPVAMAREALRLGGEGEGAGEAAARSASECGDEAEGVQRSAPRGASNGAARTDPTTADRLLSVARGFMELCAEHGAAEVVAVATAALREAPDREALLARLHREAGLAVELLDGEEEARLAYLGLGDAVDLRGRRALCLDLGGGSTEVAAGEGERLLIAASLPLGAVRLTRQLQPGDVGGRVSEAAWDVLCARVAEAVGRLASDVRRLGPLEAYGIAGTVRSLVGLRWLSESGRRRTPVADDGLDLPVAERLAARLRRMTVRERIEVAGLCSDRADVIVAGAAILVTLLRELGLGNVRFVSTGLREGMVMRYLDTHRLAGGENVR